MAFCDMRIRDIEYILSYTPRVPAFRSEGRHDHIVGVQLSGEALHTFSDKEFVLCGNCVYFFNQREDYAVQVREAGVAYSVHFTTLAPIETESFCVHLTNASSFARQLISMEKRFATHAPALSLLSDVYRFCAQLDQIRERTYAPTDRRVLAAEQYLRAHFREERCLPGAVSASTLSSRRLCDLFHQRYGTSPHRYLIGLRIGHAQRLLQAPQLSVAQVADACGFHDIYHFSHTFKQETGLTPREYRILTP